MEFVYTLLLTVALSITPSYCLEYTLSSNDRVDTESAHVRLARQSPTVVPTPGTNGAGGTFNITVDHRYYKSQYFQTGSNFFLDVKLMNDGNIQHHQGLSTKYAHASAQLLKFKFPYYGHLVDRLIVTTGGFLFVGPSWHRFATETHYIAPLMANFNPNISADSKIYLYSTETRFIAQWDKLVLNDQRSHGDFTFQVQLYPNGSVVFAYKDIPVPVSNLSDANHAVRVGMSNAFIRNINIGNLRFREIVRYHTLSLPTVSVRPNAAFEIAEVPTCVTAKSCGACNSGLINFQCQWCEQLQLCSDSVDWFNQRWIDSGCPVKATSICDPSTASRQSKKDGLSSSAKGAIIAIVFVVLIVAVVIGFLLWAYLHPTSSSGMMLIKYNPRKWFKKDES